MQITEREELTERLTIVREGIAYCEQIGEPVGEWQRTLAADLEAQIARLGSSTGAIITVPDGTGTGKPRALTDRREAGSVAKNQYGTFTVRYASEKQTRFIGSLLARKDLAPLATQPIPLDVPRLREQVAANQVNLRAASDIIERLLALPDLPPTPGAAPTGEKATDKQIALIRRLAGEKALTDEDRAKVLGAVDTLSKKGASATIDKLFALPKATAPARAIEAGVYTDGTTIYRVYLGQNSGQMLAAKAIQHADGTAEFEYAGKADRFVTSAFTKLPLAEAAAFGKATGTCIVCARRLDVPESVDRGIGPVCYAKMGY